MVLQSRVEQCFVLFVLQSLSRRWDLLNFITYHNVISNNGLVYLAA